MKICLTCKRTYANEALEFCLTDGSRLSALNDSEVTLPARSVVRGLQKKRLVIGAAILLVLAAFIGATLIYKQRAERERAGKEGAQREAEQTKAALAKVTEENAALKKKLDDAIKKAADDLNAKAHEGTVSSQLDIAAGYYLSNGFVKTHDYHIDRLPNSSTASFTLDLRSGWQYILISACDEDCSDIDIYVYDGAGNQVAEDTDRDDRPTVPVSVLSGGEFRVKVVMYKCNSRGCAYGIGAFGKM